MKPENIYNIPHTSSDGSEIFEKLCHGKSTIIERIISTGQVTEDGKWYDADQDEWVILMQGHATLEWESGLQTHLSKGDHLLIKAHEKHRVTFTSHDPPCIWIAVYFDSLITP